VRIGETLSPQNTLRKRIQEVQHAFQLVESLF